MANTDDYCSDETICQLFLFIYEDLTSRTFIFGFGGFICLFVLAGADNLK